jgi:phospholipid/cholesterol/gamma-HCH transport system substrate-binding protein
MEKGRTLETAVGLLVIAVAVLFFNYVYTKSGWEKIDGYTLTATFDKADGLSEGTDVKLSGIRVGKVLSAVIDPKTFMAIVKFYVSRDIVLPKDTGAAVQSDGLMGSRYLALIPGGEVLNLKEGDNIETTSGAVSLESLIGSFVLSKNEKEPANIKN